MKRLTKVGRSAWLFAALLAGAASVAALATGKNPRPQVARELGIVAPHLLDEPLGVLASDEGSMASPSG